MNRAEVRWITGGATASCGLAVLHATGPQGEAVATIAAVVVLSTAVVAGLVGYRVHVLRIRRDIEAREARGQSLLRQVRLSPPSSPRRPVCPTPDRRPEPRRPAVRCGRGRKRYR